MQHLLEHQITITVEYLLSSLNVDVDWQSRSNRDPSELELCAKKFQHVCQIRRTPKVDLLPSRLSHQLPQYFAWKPDLSSQGKDALQQICGNQFLMHVSHIASSYKPWRKRVTTKQKKCCFSHQLGSFKSGTPRPSPPLLETFIVSPSLLPKNASLINPQGNSLSSNCKQNITTSGVNSIREKLLKKGFSETAAQLITSTRRKSSHWNCNSSQRVWGS